MAFRNWEAVKNEYQRGEGSCRQLAEKWGLSPSRVSQKCAEDGWRRKIVELERKIEKNVEKALLSRITTEKMALIEAHEKKAVAVAERLVDGVTSSLEQMQPAADPQALAQLSVALQRSNQVARLNLGAIDPEHRAAAEAPGGPQLQAQLLAVLYALRGPAPAEGPVVELSGDDVERIADTPTE